MNKKNFFFLEKGFLKSFNSIKINFRPSPKILFFQILSLFIRCYSVGFFYPFKNKLFTFGFNLKAAAAATLAAAASAVWAAAVAAAVARDLSPSKTS